MEELKDRLTSQELRDWMAYYKIEPFGSERDNMHAAAIASTVAAAAPFRKGRPPKFEDFMFSSIGNKRRMTDDEMFNAVEAMVVMHNQIFEARH